MWYPKLRDGECERLARGPREDVMDLDNPPPPPRSAAMARDGAVPIVDFDLPDVGGEGDGEA